MADSRVGDLTQKTSLQSGDRLYVITDPTGTRAGQQILASDLAIFADQTPQEQNNSIVPINRNYRPGDPHRYDSAADLFDGNDKTSAFQSAVDSGHSAIADYEGTIKFEGTITLDGDKSLYLGNGLNLERAGTSTAPMIHLYGNRNILDGRGATIRNVLNANPNGIILIGPALTEIEGGTTDVQCYENAARNFKLVGPENGGNPQDDGAPGIFIHSLRRRKYTVANPTYDTTLEGLNIVNCDVGIEFSTDANRSVLRDVTVKQWKTGVIYMNASYGNQIFGLAFESPLDWTGGSPRYAIHLMSQNSGTETNTDPTYAITQAYNNYFYCYCELAPSGKGRLMNWDVVTTLGGYNRFMGPMSTSDGFGKDGSTDHGGLGTNTVESAQFYADTGKLFKLPGELRFERCNDDSGSFWSQEGKATVVGRKANMDEGTHYNVFALDNFGGSGASIDDSAFFEITYAAKAAENSHTHSGKIVYHCSIENNVAQTPSVISHEFDTRDEDPIVRPVITAAAGTATNTAKFTVSFETLDVPAVTTINYAFMSCEMVVSPLEGTTLDWSEDISFLATTYGTATTDNKWRSKSKVKATDETIQSDTSLNNDAELIGWDLDIDTTYIFEGEIVTESGAAEDSQWRFLPSQTPQDYAIAFTANDTTLNQTTINAVQNTGKSPKTHWTLSGSITTHATVAGTLNFQWAQIVSGAVDTTVYAGSWVRLTRLDSLEFQ